MKWWLKMKSKIMNSIKFVIRGILLLCVLWLLISNILTWYEKENNKFIGEMVTVDEKKMHLYIN